MVVPTFFGLLFVSPWLFQVLSNYQHLSFGQTGAVQESLPVEMVSLDFLFSSKDLFWGGSPIQYSLLVLLCSLLGLAAFLFGRRDGSIVLLSGSSALLLIYIGILTFIATPNIQDFDTCLRYMIPFIVGIVPVVLLLSYCYLNQQAGFSVFSIFFSSMVLALTVQFLPQTKSSFEQFFECGSILAFKQFACSDNYKKYNNSVLNTASEQPVKKDVLFWQNNVPAGEALIAWVDAPFYLDFTRNQIFEVDTAGLANPWVHLPTASYVLLQHAGYATNTMKSLQIWSEQLATYNQNFAKKSLEFLRYLGSVTKKVIYLDNRVIVFEILNAETDNNWGNSSLIQVKKELKNSPDDPDLRYKLGTIYTKKEEYEKAYKTYLQILEVQSQHTQALTQLAYISYLTGRFEKAAEFYKRLLKKDPENSVIHFNIACVYSKKNELDDSIHWLKSALKKGFTDWDSIQTDEDLKNLRVSPQYKDILKKYNIN